MATDFKYIPLAPEALSGPSFIDQTEQAINELRDMISGATGDLDEIRQIAENALTTANSALQTSQDALSIANSASNDAATALAAANNALSAAQAAQTTADNALTVAHTAQSTAELAQTSADNAFTVAQQAQETADNAINIAGQAITIAQQALGVYTLNATDSLDANTYFLEPEKMYITGDTLVNFPIEAQFYFDVYSTSDNSSAYQKVFTANVSWQRTAVLSTDSGNDITAEWGQWTLLEGGGSNATKDEILAPITVNNPSADFTNLLGDNSDYYLNVTDAVGMPVAKKGIGEVRTDTTREHTSIRYTTVDGEIFTRYSNSTPDLTVGAGEYLVTLTSGTSSTYDYLVVRAQAGNTLSARTTLNSVFSTNESSTGAIGLPVTLEFWSGDTTLFDFDTNGFTLTIQDNQGTPSDTITFTYDPDGTTTITSGTATIDGKASLRFLSGERTVSGGASATFNLYLGWTDYSGSVEWSDWLQVGAVNYSTTPHTTGQKWIDGSAIYQVTIDCGALPNAGISNIPHGLTIATLIKAEGATQTAASDSFILLPHVGALADGSFNVQVDVNATDIVIKTSSDLSAYTQTYVTLTYTAV